MWLLHGGLEGVQDRGESLEQQIVRFSSAVFDAIGTSYPMLRNAGRERLRKPRAACRWQKLRWASAPVVGIARIQAMAARSGTRAPCLSHYDPGFSRKAQNSTGSMSTTYASIHTTDAHSHSAGRFRLPELFLRPLPSASFWQPDN